MRRVTVVLGIDVAAGRWVGVLLRDGAFAGAAVAASVHALLSGGGLGGDAAVVGVDMPIGLPALGSVRASDVAAQAFLGPRRRASLFLTPPREALEPDDHAEASARSVAATGKGISRQAWGLRARIFELEPVARADARVHEVHPECSFAELSRRGVGLAAGKRTWAGTREREALLRGAGVVLPHDLGTAGEVPVDDVLDAAVAAWSAARIAAGVALALPADARGRDGVIWR